MRHDESLSLSRTLRSDSTTVSLADVVFICFVKVRTLRLVMALSRARYAFVTDSIPTFPLTAGCVERKLVLLHVDKMDGKALYETVQDTD